MTAICFVTGGLASDFYPYFYLTIPATAMRFGVRETVLAFAWHAVLSAVIYAWAPGPPAAAGVTIAMREVSPRSTSAMRCAKKRRKLTKTVAQPSRS